jgi:hypothetical protein
VTETLETALDLKVGSFASLLNQRIVVLAESDDYVAIDQHFFEAALRPFIRRIKIDERWYLATYPDVTRAIDRKTVRDARDHYERFGYFENRLPYPIEVKESWYANAYPDVKEAIARRDFPSAQTHFERNGFREGRVPYPGFEFDLV